MDENDYYRAKVAYRETFGVEALDWCNDFALNMEEVLTYLERALERRSPVTDEEIKWLHRDVRPDVFY